MPNTEFKQLNTVGCDESQHLTTDDWQSINWKKVERSVFKLQERIYKANEEGNIPQVRKLQKTLVNSWNAKLLATRRVTQENRGKKTAGIDKVKSLNPKQRYELAKRLKLGKKAQPARRVWIPKANKDEKRPLSIPVMEDRAKQFLLKLALEPEWEQKFEPHSYGFRPAKCTHDAIKAIYNSLSQTNGKWILDADIAGCFDNINHEYLIQKINTCPKFQRQIKAWLKAGVIDWNVGKNVQYTRTGTPQGGVISPLLANIALHGMETHIKEWLWSVKKYRVRYWSKTQNRMMSYKQTHTKSTISIIRYADDFVIIHEDKEIILEVKEEIKNFLKPIGLELKDSKTNIRHSTEGIDFLGCNIRHYQTGKYRSDRNTKSIPTNYTLLIKPSKKSIKEHYEQLSHIVDRHKACSQEKLISTLNPVIRGWCNYYKHYSSKETFGKVENLLFNKLLVWCKRRHPNKGNKWAYKKYFHMDYKNGIKWDFRADTEDKQIRIIDHSNTKITRYNHVKGDKSIFDGDYVYWTKRLKYHPLFTIREITLIKIQKGRCNICKTPFKLNDRWEVDHIKPRCLGGKNTYENLQLIHQHCHYDKTRKERITNNSKAEINSIKN